MTGLSTLLGCSAAVLLICMVLLWLLSLRLGDASIVDIFWGTGYVIVAGLGFAIGDGALRRGLLVAVLTGIWGLRLSLHLAVRNVGHGEDARYQAIRRRVGPNFPLVSLGMVFLFQGTLIWIIALPLQAAIAAREPLRLGFLDALGVLFWAVGLGFEAIGDWQLTRFRADPMMAGKVLDTGLWRYTRHPNYFGDALLWWGLWCFAAAVGDYWTVISPVLMTFFLLRVSGVALLEKGLVKRRADYAAYIARTSAFVPWPPKNR